MRIGKLPAAFANFSVVLGLNCADQNLPYIQVLTVQPERQESCEFC
jgi:hypothetical protein